MFVSIAVFVQKPINQFILNSVLLFSYSIYLASARPWIEIYWDYIELASELVHIFLNYFLILFTDIIENVDHRLYFGWVYSGIILVYTLINLFIIVPLTIRSLSKYVYGLYIGFFENELQRYRRSRRSTKFIWSSNKEKVK